MSSTMTLIVALGVYTLVAAYLYRHPLREYLRRKRGLEPSGEHPPFGPAPRLLATVLLFALGGVMVLAGTALVFDSGNIRHSVPIDSHEFVQLLKDVIPGMLSIVVGFLLLESTLRIQGGRGLRPG